MPAITKAIVESELIEQYHWTFEELDRAPYKRLQQHFIIKKNKTVIQQNKANIQKFKDDQQNSSSSGQMRRSYREV